MVLHLVRDQVNKSNYHYLDAQSHNEIAWTEYDSDGNTALRLGAQSYEFPLRLTSVPKIQVKCPYPISGTGKKALGWPIMSTSSKVGYYYGEAITCRRKWIFKRNIGLTAFQFAGNSYQMYRVGLLDEACHYYCLLDASFQTIGIIKRHNSRNAEALATIYVEHEQNLPVVLVAWTVEMIVGSGGSRKDSRTDSTAGRYISVLEEERRILDRDFLERVEVACHE